MRIARQTIVHPTAGMTQRVEAVLDELESTYSTFPGYILGFRYKSHTMVGPVGRLAIWRSLDDANHASGNTHVQALRSQLNNLIQGEHVEHVLEVEGAPQNLPE
ncbi:MAG: hypothetical protein HYU30_04590 [Chloroflexi bacterium]|nr:hypothetical protein [Chloroflexota bacterium]